MSLMSKSADARFAEVTEGSGDFDLAEPVAREIALISHELRNSLNVVRIAARLLRQPLKADSIDNTRLLIERHVDQMTRHVQELLDSSQLGTRTTHRLRLARVDLRVIARHAIDAMASDLALRGHRLAVSLPPDAVLVRADGARLEQVFTNLLVNAAKYTTAGGDISLTLSARDGHARLVVRDSGIGIAPKFIPRIFDMFVQVDPAAPGAEDGRGIGLAVVREYVELHGGSVGVLSGGLGSGSEFTVRLPTL